MPYMQIPADTHVKGNLSCETMTIPSSTLTNAGVASDAAIAATKMLHRWRPFLNQAHGSAGTSERRTVYEARGNATINFCRAVLSVAPSGAATHVIQVKKNGSDILSTAITLDNANANYTSEAAVGFTSASLVAGDTLEITVTATAGGGTLGQGLLVYLDIDEAP